MRGAGNDPIAGAAHFLQLRHQVVLGMKTAGGIDNHIIDGARLGCLQGVEHHGAWIGASLLTNHVHACPVRPDFKLLYGSSTERIGSTEQHLALLAQKAMSQFADSGGLPRPIDADQHHNRRRLRDDALWGFPRR